MPRQPGGCTPSKRAPKSTQVISQTCGRAGGAGGTPLQHLQGDRAQLGETKAGESLTEGHLQVMEGWRLL